MLSDDFLVKRRYSSLKKLNSFADLKPSFIKHRKNILQIVYTSRQHEIIMNQHSSNSKPTADVFPALNIPVKDLITLSAGMNNHLNFGIQNV